MSNDLRNLIRDAVLALLVAVVFFLWVSSFFASWTGQAVSVRSPGDAVPAAYTVLIVAEDGTEVEVDWPARVVEGRELPFNDRGVPPADIPEDAPTTRKAAFQLVFYVENAEGTNEVVPSTSPRGLGLSVIVWILLMALRNMITSGSPFDYIARERQLPKQQTAMGELAPRKTISKKTRPEKRRRGRR